MLLVISGGRVVEAQSDALVAQLSAALLEFEAAMTWEATDEAWPDRRDQWVAQVSRARSTADIARGIGRLVGSMRDESVDDGFPWEWMNTPVNTVFTPAELARLLLEIERFTKWEATDDSWEEERPEWMDKLRNIAP